MKNGPYHFVSGHRQERGQPRGEFEELEATELYCSTCRRAVPVRKFLLLVLPEGDKYEYRCRVCGSTAGDKIDKSAQFRGIVRA
jgi:hypothetical protein